MNYYYCYQLADYHVLIAERDGSIHTIFSNTDSHQHPSLGEERETDVIREASMQLKQYFEKSRRTFTFPIEITGTPFQRRVYNALLEIPYGQTASYKEIAERAGSPKGYRAVGNTVNRNPLWIAVPCHRVIGSDGSLVGYAGGLQMKKKLLEIEGYRRS
ncbi:MAG: methylated-DNA--[protein]-cysteine S-methyltransferase [Sphaerochaetaceae bacterium]|nr:methylated-DNA--[protein]-cysteine S-methyltransferase [Sphaerochaetaceae bacterium]